MPGQSRTALYIRSGLAACEEDATQAVNYLMKAADCYEQAKMPLREQLLRYRLGEVHSGPDSRASTTGRSNGSKGRGSWRRRGGRGCTLRGMRRLRGIRLKRLFEV